ncbi:MAG: substrate-binding domain-containing protein [Chloroflexota bacterium]|jgi:signal transduction histidine kinase/DNA-binding LacI/PurR family transcriptional regulator/response regulator RpfG family c-di-GMP phosphodiesterase
MNFSISSLPTIGVLAGWQFYRTATNLSYLAPIFRGMSRAAHSLTCNLLLGCGIGPSASPSDPYRPAWSVPAAEQDFVPIGPWNTQGLIVATPLHSIQRAEYIQQLRAAGLPVLFIGSGETGPTIAANNAAGIFQAVQHLVEHGRCRLAFIAGSADDLRGDSGQRLDAFRAACAQFGLEQDPRLMVYGRHVYDGGFAGAQQLLASGSRFDALIASNDESAMGAMDALKQAGVRIPDDVAVVGFDNRLEGAVQLPALTSVHVPLFNIGYHAVEQMWRHLTLGEPLPPQVAVDTHLVVRQSCGCGAVSAPEAEESVSWQPLPLSQKIAAQIQKQAYDLEETETLTLCQMLTDAFERSLSENTPAAFRAVLAEVLNRAAHSEDGAHIWQDAISLLAHSPSAHANPALSQSLLDEARVTISKQMQQQYRLYALTERWASSRLSLLTARLLTALDESQIYDILERYLPDLDIQTAMVGLFEPEGDDPFAWTILRNALDSHQTLIRFRSQDFPPEGLFPKDRSFSLTLIPLTDQTGQIGFMVFNTAHLNLYGAIVQQLGSALNTARLYRQATEARRAAEEANRLKSRFLSTISHELRAPLNLIVGLSGLILEEGDEHPVPIPDATRRDIERVHAYAQHLGGLIGDVIDLASSGAGQLRLQYEAVDLGETLQVAAESGAQLALDNGLAWHADLPESGPWVWGDRTRLRQVVLNLVNNAIKFTPHGEVSLSLRSVNGQAQIAVRDTGLGIPVEEQPRIFDAFHRSERAVAEGYPGLGLGLSISKTLVEMHGGQIEVVSSGKPGEGTTFLVKLPEIPPPEKQKTPAAETFAEKSILLLFQTPADHHIRLAERLRQQGVRLTQAPLDRSSEWQPQLAVSPPDAIVLDIKDESNLAWRVMRMIKSLPSAQDIPVMFYTASPQGEALLNLDYLTKPIDPKTLLRALDQNLTLSDAPAQSVRTFLVVDDDVQALEMHARILRLHSPANRVLAAQNGREALKILLKERVDLVLLDLQMPEMDGFAVLQAMREAPWTHNIPVIVVTGKDLTEEDLTRLNEGVAVVLQKGLFGLEETVAHISAALERKRRLSVDAQRLVRQAMLYIHKHYSEPITRADIARHINIAEDYLTFCFRQELGTTPIKYLQRYRVHQAKALLKNTSRSVSEIALDVGFSDSGYFTRVFHRETGMSPENFRRA